jgi:hypothetical protein
MTSRRMASGPATAPVMRDRRAAGKNMITIRPEQRGDIAAIRAINEAAFGQPGICLPVSLSFARLGPIHPNKRALR